MRTLSSSKGKKVNVYEGSFSQVPPSGYTTSGSVCWRLGDPKNSSGLLQEKVYQHLVRCWGPLWLYETTKQQKSKRFPCNDSHPRVTNFSGDLLAACLKFSLSISGREVKAQGSLGHAPREEFKEYSGFVSLLPLGSLMHVLERTYFNQKTATIVCSRHGTQAWDFRAVSQICHRYQQGKSYWEPHLQTSAKADSY